MVRLEVVRPEVARLEVARLEAVRTEAVGLTPCSIPPPPCLVVAVVERVEEMMLKIRRLQRS